MRLKFEQLEQRLALSGMAIDIDGPQVAYAGDLVEFEVAITAGDAGAPSAARVGLNFFSYESGVEEVLENVQWQLDGVPWDNTGEDVQLGPGETRVFTTTGTVVEGIEYFLFHAGLSYQGKGSSRGYATWVLDNYADAGTIGGAVYWHQGWGMEIPTWAENVQSVQPAGDLNSDGYGDAFVVTIKEVPLDGGNESALQRIRHTYFGTESWWGRSDSELLETSEPYDSLAGPPWSDWPAYWRPVEGGGRGSIGDVDGDGYEDEFIGRTEGNSADRLVFGPDHRDNFVVVSNELHWIVTGGSPGTFGHHAGSLGDVNGDGFGDFYVLRKNMMGGENLLVLHGRDFGRDLPADIDGSGTVDFADFLVLAYNYGNENVTRSEGDLDGDGLVAFSDFIVLRDTFGQSKADVPLSL